MHVGAKLNIQVGLLPSAVTGNKKGNQDLIVILQLLLVYLSTKQGGTYFGMDQLQKIFYIFRSFPI